MNYAAGGVREIIASASVIPFANWIKVVGCSLARLGSRFIVSVDHLAGRLPGF